jgi:hypothetical protein
MNLAKQLNNFSNDNAYNPMKQACLANLSLHSLSIGFPNLLVWDFKEILIRKLP